MQAVERALGLETVGYCVARTFSRADGKGIVFRTPLHARIENESFSLYYPSPWRVVAKAIRCFGNGQRGMTTLIKHGRDSKRRMNFSEGDARHYNHSMIRNSGSIGNGACRARLVRALVEFHAHGGGHLELAGAIVS
jgi:hypothetical protein